MPTTRRRRSRSALPKFPIPASLPAVPRQGGRPEGNFPVPGWQGHPYRSPLFFEKNPETPPLSETREPFSAADALDCLYICPKVSGGSSLDLEAWTGIASGLAAVVTPGFRLSPPLLPLLLSRWERRRMPKKKKRHKCDALSADSFCDYPLLAFLTSFPFSPNMSASRVSAAAFSIVFVAWV